MSYRLVYTQRAIKDIQKLEHLVKSRIGKTFIKVENLSKEYRLGTVSHHTMAKDMQSWWARMRGKEDPNLLLDSTLQLEMGKNEIKRKFGEKWGVFVRSSPVSSVCRL